MTEMLYEKIKKLPLPEWFKEHDFFKSNHTIKKAFPYFGLPNMQEEIEVPLNAEAVKAAAYELSLSISGEIDRLCVRLSEKNRLLMNEISYHLRRSITVIENNKASIKIHQDLKFDDKIIFKKNQSLFKAYGYVKDIFDEEKISLARLEDFHYFKQFSQLNGGGKLNICFHSDGLDGLWELATISMRGIKSCQSWENPQSRGLIGSVTNRFVGVVSIISKNKKTDYGYEHLSRALVRVCSDKDGKIVLFMDCPYGPQGNTHAPIIYNWLSKKSKIPVVRSFGGLQHFYDRYTEKFLSNYESTYMDNKIPFKQMKKAPGLRDVFNEIYIKNPKIDRIAGSLFSVNHLPNQKIKTHMYKSLIKSKNYFNADEFKNLKKDIVKYFTNNM